MFQVAVVRIRCGGSSLGRWCCYEGSPLASPIESPEGRYVERRRESCVQMCDSFQWVSSCVRSYQLEKVYSDENLGVSWVGNCYERKETWKHLFLSLLWYTKGCL